MQSHPTYSGRHAFFLPDLGDGGAQRVVVNLVNGFVRRGAAVDLVVAKGQGPFRSKLDATVRLHDLGCTRTLSAVPRLAAFLRRERPVSVTAAMSHANAAALMAAALAGTRTRIIVAEHCHLSSNRDNAISWIDRHALPWLMKRLYRRADAILCVSAGVRDDIATQLQIPVDRIGVIANPVITQDLLASFGEPVQHRWFSDGEPPVLLGVGRMVPQKDFSTLIKACALLHDRGCPVRLIILGQGPEREALLALTRQLGLADSIDMPGYVQYPAAYMARAGALVLSSRWEGLPTVLIEAMAAGCPVVSTDCPSGPREILMDGHYGHLVPTADVAALAGAIEAVLRDPLPSAYLKGAVQRFTTDAVLDRYWTVMMGGAEAPDDDIKAATVSRTVSIR
ncbi:glycosyltransferase [Azospirillum sp. BE72]|uniref:glycosyltransferase n=1 Tax=Azospirillum sp. BE72 TaxID=2817776 RepID=UPI00285F695F|nr:glycosyltransferase [Azospirillum sp. BE72]MDR6773708.1 glycosyltransferase involved in cell wall biosynthesis [Azospirillum sp. BE72]